MGTAGTAGGVRLAEETGDVDCVVTCERAASAGAAAAEGRPVRRERNNALLLLNVVVTPSSAARFPNGTTITVAITNAQSQTYGYQESKLKI